MVGLFPSFAPQYAWLLSHNLRARLPSRILAQFHEGGGVEVADKPSQARGGTLLGSISEFCQRSGMAESTFGRRAVNDGKFVARLRDGARVTPETLNRVNQFMERHGSAGAGDSPPELLPLVRASAAQPAKVLPRNE